MGITCLLRVHRDLKWRVKLLFSSLLIILHTPFAANVSQRTLTSPPVTRTRWASRKKSARFVPIRERQKIAKCTDASFSGTWAMSQAVTRGLGDTKSNEKTFMRKEETKHKIISTVQVER